MNNFLITGNEKWKLYILIKINVIPPNFPWKFISKSSYTQKFMSFRKHMGLVEIVFHHVTTI